MNDLVKRLRDEQFDGWSGNAVCVDAELASEAADLIDAQAKLIEEMRPYVEYINTMKLYRASMVYLKMNAEHVLSKASKSNPNTPERNDK